LQARPDLALPSFQVAQGEVRIDIDDLEAEAVLRLERGTHLGQELDARGDLRAGSRFEAGQYARRRTGPYRTVCLGQDPAAGVALGQLEVDMPAIHARVDHLD